MFKPVRRPAIATWMEKNYPTVYRHTKLSVDYKKRLITLDIDFPAVLDEIIDPLASPQDRLLEALAVDEKVLSLKLRLQQTTNDGAFDGVEGYRVIILDYEIPNTMRRDTARWKGLR